MIIMTFNNWKRKLRMLVIVFIVGAVIGSCYLLLERSDLALVENADNDRDARGSLKVDAGPLSNGEFLDENWLGTFKETIKTFCYK